MPRPQSTWLTHMVVHTVSNIPDLTRAHVPPRGRATVVPSKPGY